MDCTEAIEQLYRYLDGELTEATRVAIVQHLDWCPPCFQIVGFEAELRRVVAQRCRDEVPFELQVRVARAIGIELPGIELPGSELPGAEPPRGLA
ncbi:MAG: mycothiol system anti-sigma-R factor [Acidimicrobiia bacterium]